MTAMHMVHTSGPPHLALWLLLGCVHAGQRLRCLLITVAGIAAYRSLAFAACKS